MFVLSRVDDRAIHGQTVTMWSKIYPTKGILLVDDKISADAMMRQVYKNAAVGMNVYIYNVENALIKAKQAGDSQKEYMLIARDPIVFKTLHEGGVNIGEKVILGPVSQGGERRLLAQFTALNEEEIAACEYLCEQGIEVVFQNVPSTQAVSWQSVNK